jgi:hypothetical protein
VGIAGIEQAQQPAAPSVVEAFVGLREQAAGPVERIVLVAPVAEGLVLHATADLVETLVGQLRDVERIGDLGRPGQHRVEGQPPGPDRSSTAQAICSHHLAGRALNLSRATWVVRLWRWGADLRVCAGWWVDQVTKNWAG